MHMSEHESLRLYMNPEQLSTEDRWEMAEHVAVTVQSELWAAQALGGLLTKEELAEKLAHHDAAQHRFATLYKLTADELRNVSFQMMNFQSAEYKMRLAEQVTQDVYERVYKALPRFEHRSTLRTWMHQITINHTYTILGQEKRRTHEVIDDIFNEEKSMPAKFVVPTEIDSIPEQEHLRRILVEGLRILTPALQSVVVLVALYDFTHASVAEELGISETASKVRFHRARQQILEFFKDHNILSKADVLKDDIDK